MDLAAKVFYLQNVLGVREVLFDREPEPQLTPKRILFVSPYDRDHRTLSVFPKMVAAMGLDLANETASCLENDAEFQNVLQGIWRDRPVVVFGHELAITLKDRPELQGAKMYFVDHPGDFVGGAHIKKRVWEQLQVIMKTDLAG